MAWAALAEARQHLGELAETADLAESAGTYGAGPIGDAARHADIAGAHLAELEHVARVGGWRERRQGRRDLPTATAGATAAEDRLARIGSTGSPGGVTRRAPGSQPPDTSSSPNRRTRPMRPQGCNWYPAHSLPTAVTLHVLRVQFGRNK